MTTYPDVLGFITKERATLGVIQAAIAITPPDAPANAERRVIVLLQNMEDQPLSVGVRFDLPRGRFVIKPDSPEVTLPAGGVGVLTAALKSAPDVAAGDYVLGAEVSIKAGQKGRAVRVEGNPFDPDTLPPAAKQHLAGLLKLAYSGKKRGLMRGHAIEAPFRIGGGQPAPHLPKPGWGILWTVESQNDMGLLVDKYGAAFVQSVLKPLKLELLFQPMAKATYERFKAAGYPLTKVEAMTAARLLVVIFDIAKGQAGATKVGALDVFHTIRTRLNPARPEEKRALTRYEPQTVRVILPQWATAYLRLIAADKRALHDPHPVIVKQLYDEVLMDALLYGLMLVEQASGEALGTEDDMREFAEQVAAKLKTPGDMNFSYAYLPLILGGLTVLDRVMMPDERIGDIMRDVRMIVEDRAEEITDETETVYKIADRMMEMTLRKYGFFGSSR